MPQRPLKPCSAPQCGALVRGQRFCERHKDRAKQAARQHDQRRVSSTQRGYTYQWQKARAAYLLIHPLCVECQTGGKVRPATEVDHIIPHQGDQELFWDESNWQGLCKPHHSEKTAREDGGFGR